MSMAPWWAELDRVGFEATRLALSALWQSSVLLGAVALLGWVLRRRRAAVRHALWAAALLAAPLLPLLAHLASSLGSPRAEIAVLPAYPQPAAPVPAAPVPVTTGIEAAEAPAPPAPAPPFVPSPPEPAPSLADYPWALALLAYGVGAAALLALVAVGRFRLALWLRRARAVAGPRLAVAIDEARRALQLRRSVRVVESTRLHAPLTLGVLRPVVLLPAGLAEGLSDKELRAVALHELAHVRRHDPLLLTLASLVRAVLFFHPLVWLAARQVASLAEQAADDAVLDATGEPLPYAKMLARIAEALPRRALATELAAGFVLSRSAFLRRVEAILSDRRAQLRRLTRWALAGTLVAGVLSLALALVLPLGAGAPPAPVDETAWGKEVDGLRTRLVPDRVVYDKGRGDFLVYLDVWNVSDRPIKVGVGDWMTREVQVFGPEGKRLTLNWQPKDDNARAHELPPGAMAGVACVQALNYYASYNDLGPGRYRVVWPDVKVCPVAAARIPPPSNEVEIEIKPGAPKKPAPALDAPFGEVKDGLCWRVTASERSFRAGQPVQMWVELKNVAGTDKSYAVPRGELGAQVLDERGSQVPYIEPRFWREPVVGGLIMSHKLEAGRKIGFGGIDLTRSHYLRRPGRYSVSLPHHKTNAFDFEILPDPAGAPDGDPIGRLLPLTQKGWEIGGCALVNPEDRDRRLVTPGDNWERVPGREIELWPTTRIKTWKDPSWKDEDCIRVWLTQEKAAPARWHSFWRKQRPAEYAGKFPHWHVYISVPPKALELWPTAKEDILLALKAEPQAGAPPPGKAPVPPRAAAGTGPSWSQAVNGLRWRVTVAEGVECGEPAVFHIELQNAGAQPLCVLKKTVLGECLDVSWRTATGRRDSYPIAWTTEIHAKPESTVVLHPGDIHKTTWTADGGTTATLPAGETTVELVYFGGKNTDPTVKGFWSGEMRTQVRFRALPPREETREKRLQASQRGLEALWALLSAHRQEHGEFPPDLRRFLEEKKRLDLWVFRVTHTSYGYKAMATGAKPLVYTEPFVKGDEAVQLELLAGGRVRTRTVRKLPSNETIGRWVDAVAATWRTDPKWFGGKGDRHAIDVDFREQVVAEVRRLAAIPYSIPIDQVYPRLDYRKRNTDWFAGVEDLRSMNAVWCLATGLAHPHVDVRIKSAQALGQRGDPAVIGPLLEAARRNSDFVSGRENATLHGIYQHALADALSQLTRTSIKLRDGQDPEGLKKGIEAWGKWVRENTAPAANGDPGPGGKGPGAGLAPPPAAKADEPPWGETNEHLRCRWIPTATPVLADTVPSVSVEVENAGAPPIVWECKSGISWGIAVAGITLTLTRHTPQFTVRALDGTRLARAGDLPGSVYADPAADGTFPGCYYLPSRGRLILTANLPERLVKPGRYQVESFVLRRVPDARDWPNNDIRCPPLQLTVVAPLTTPAKEGARPAPAGAPGKPGTTSGRVLTAPGGEGLAGATVSLWNHGNGKSLDAKTSDDGRYSFAGVEPGDYTLRIIGHPDRKPGTWSEGVVVHQIAETHVQADDLCLTLPQSLSGTVRDAETGQPVAGVTINFSTAEKNRNSVLTDSGGRYRLYVTPRQVALYCEGTHDRYSSEGEGKEVPVRPGEHVASVDFQVRSAPPFAGQVSLPEGAPPGSVDVHVEVWWKPPGIGRTFRLKTDDQGRFHGYLRPPSHGRSEQRHPAGREEKITLKGIAWLADRSKGGVAHGETRSRDPRPEPLRITLGDSATATFRIVDPDGKPVTNATVTASDVQPGFNPHFGGPVRHLGGGVYEMTRLIPGLDYFFSATGPELGLPFGQAARRVLGPGEKADLGALKLEWVGKKAVPRLIAELQSKNKWRREGAAHELGAIGPDAAPAVPALIAVLITDEEYTVRYAVAEALGRIGPAAGPAVPHLIRALRDREYPVRRDAAKALGLIGDPAARPALQAALEDAEDDVRKAVAGALRQLQERPAPPPPEPQRNAQGQAGGLPEPGAAGGGAAGGRGDAQACRLSGTVATPEGARVPEALVYLERIERPGQMRRYQARTDDKGEYVFTDVAEGDYILTVHGPPKGAHGKTPSDSRAMDVSLSRERPEQRLDVTLAPDAARLLVTLLLPNGQPARNCDVEMGSAEAFTTSAAHGRTNAEGVVEVAARRALTKRLFLSVPALRAWALVAGKVEETAREARVTAKLEPGGAVSGRVVAKGTGRPVGGVAVKVCPAGLAPFSDGTRPYGFATRIDPTVSRDGDGAFRVPCLPAGDYAFEGDTFRVVAGRDTEGLVLNHAVPQGSAALRGQALDVKGAPVANREIVLLVRDAFGFDEPPNRRVVADAEGRFTLYPLEPRLHELALALPDGEPGKPVKFETQAGKDARDVVFRLGGGEARPAAGEMPPADPPGTWGATGDRLHTRVTVEKPKVSQWEPVVVKVEIGNVGKWPESYDPQDLRWDIRAVRPDGKPVRNIAEPYQTAGHAREIAPGGTLALSLDLAQEHDLTLPGTYRVRFEPREGPPPSNVATFEVVAHDPTKPLPPVGVALPPGLVEAVESALPKDWAFMGTSAPARGKGFAVPRAIWIAYRKEVSTALAIEIGHEGMNWTLLLYDRRRGEDPLKDKTLRSLGQTDWYRAYARGKPDPRLGWKDPDGDIARALRLKTP